MVQAVIIIWGHFISGSCSSGCSCNSDSGSNTRTAYSGSDINRILNGHNYAATYRVAVVVSELIRLD